MIIKTKKFSKYKWKYKYFNMSYEKVFDKRLFTLTGKIQILYEEARLKVQARGRQAKVVEMI